MSRALVSAARAPRNKTLGRRIMMIAMTATFAALLMSATALLVYEIQTYRTAWVNDLTTQADLIAQTIGPALVFDDPKAAAQSLGALKLRPQITLAAVFDGKRKLFASYRDSAADRDPLPDQGTAVGPRFSGAVLELYHPITQNGEQVGTVYLRAHHDVAGRIVDYLWILVLASLAGLAFAALVFQQLHPAITRPILAMSNVARRVMEDRDYTLRVRETSDGEIGVLVAAFNSMLDELAAEMDERRHAEEALRANDQRKDQFLATLAHELRNPLAPLSSALALLKRADENPTVRAEMREMMQRQLTQMVRLIDDLLEVSRITRGKLELRRAPVDLVPIARQALESTQTLLRQKNHRQRITIPAEEIWVDADSARLIQVLVNLLNNAAKYTPANGEIGLTVQREGSTASVTVSDSGIGIEPHKQQAVFDMFVQLDNSLERGAAGLGIGLTIARELVQLHGGTLGLDSAGLGKGCRFTVTLPVIAAPHQPQTDDAAPVLESRHPGMRVLIADDNADFADSFARVLRLEGHEVAVVNDGRQALDSAARSTFDVAFLDIGMPGLNGLDLAAQLRAGESTRRMDLVAVTGWGQESDRQRVRAAGFDRHLVKPIDLQQVLALMETLRGDRVTRATR